MNKIVVGVVGMPGSGKGIVDEVSKKFGFSIVVMGDFIREEAKRIGLEPTPKNLANIMINLREKGGPTIIAKKSILKIKESLGNKVLVEGIRSLTEVEEFKKIFPKLKLIAIHSSPRTRYMRLYNRKRSDDPKNWKEFIERDLRELQINLGSAIAVADYMIVNENLLFQFKSDIEKVFNEILVDIINQDVEFQ